MQLNGHNTHNDNHSFEYTHSVFTAYIIHYFYNSKSTCGKKKKKKKKNCRFRKYIEKYVD